MTDKYGCHGDGANEVVVRALGWQMVSNLAQDRSEKERNDT